MCMSVWMFFWVGKKGPGLCRKTSKTELTCDARAKEMLLDLYDSFHVRRAEEK